MKEKQDNTSNLSEELLPSIEELANELPGGFFIYKAHGQQELLYANDAMVRIFGCDDMEEFKELVGNSFQGIVHPEDYGKVETNIWKQITTSSYDLDYVEYRILRKDGSVRWVEDYGHFRKTENHGDVFYVFIEDATERMQARIEELESVNAELENQYARESQYKKAILYDAVKFFEVNLTKNEFITMDTRISDGKFMNMSNVMDMSDISSYTDYVNFWAERTDEKEEYLEFCDRERLIRCFEEGKLEESIECWVKDAFDRRRLYKRIVLLGKDEMNGDVIALALAKDITRQREKQKLFEMALRQADAANIARQTFLSDMSHDIRTPLNSIIGFTTLMQKREYPKEKLDDYMNQIRKSSEQLLSIVTESLEVTRMESGKAVLTEDACNILDIITIVEKDYAPEFAKKGVSFQIEKNQIVHFNIIADSVRIYEVISQLVDNALKYTPEHGKVVLSVTELPGKVKEQGVFQLCVQDTGIGIGAEFLPYIYEPFERENNSTASGVFGSGLGLSVVKGMLDMLGGSIDVKSEVGKGTIFTVEIPVHIEEYDTEAASLEAAESPEETSLEGRRVLVVEDNKINMELLTALLRESKFIVEQAENGKLALDMVKAKDAGTYDIILMDIQMPVMDGYQATEAIRGLEDPEKSEIPIIAVSANAFAEDQEKSRISGMNAHCPKPIDIVHLLELMEQEISK